MPIVMHCYEEIKIYQTDSATRWGGRVIPKGYVSATEMLRATPKKKSFSHYINLESTKEYLEYLLEDLKTDTKEYGNADTVRVSSLADLIITVRGGLKEQGTWLHPEVAIHFAQWLSPKFAIWANRVLRLILEGKDKERNNQEWNEARQRYTEEAYLIRLIPEVATVWECRYPVTFWFHLARLTTYKKGNPQCAFWINKFIYGLYSPEIRARLEEVNPLLNGYRKNRIHQHFKYELLENLEKALESVFLLMEVADDNQQFERMYARKFKGEGFMS